jgi:hypothetical protein
MPLDDTPLQSAAAFTPAIFEPPGRRGFANAPTVRPIYVHGSGTPVLDEASEDPLRKLLDEAAGRRLLQHSMENQIDNRLVELRIDALVDGEPFSEASALDLRQFVRSVGVTKRPGIFLLDNGNVRALWRGTDGQQVGLQFLGSGSVQFVIFSQRERPRMMMREAGVDSTIETRVRVMRDQISHLLIG